mmetsp:Transcript_25509/g.42784  ORF Transcript_25509/g.42784 Transcript_25509/m.42784 type:complete len:316 (+) Transcript_25509:819-1766(+)
MCYLNALSIPTTTTTTSRSHSGGAVNTHRTWSNVLGELPVHVVLELVDGLQRVQIELQHGGVRAKGSCVRLHLRVQHRHPGSVGACPVAQDPHQPRRPAHAELAAFGEDHVLAGKLLVQLRHGAGLAAVEVEGRGCDVTRGRRSSQHRLGVVQRVEVVVEAPDRRGTIGRLEERPQVVADQICLGLGLEVRRRVGVLVLQGFVLGRQRRHVDSFLLIGGEEFGEVAGVCSQVLWVGLVCTSQKRTTVLHPPGGRPTTGEEPQAVILLISCIHVNNRILCSFFEYRQNELSVGFNRKMLQIKIFATFFDIIVAVER